MVIRGYQRSSEVPRGPQRSSEVLRGPQRSSEAIITRGSQHLEASAAGIRILNGHRLLSALRPTGGPISAAELLIVVSCLLEAELHRDLGRTPGLESDPHL